MVSAMRRSIDAEGTSGHHSDEIFSSWLAADPSARSSISAELVTALEGDSSDAELVAVARALGEAMTQVESWCLKYPQSSDLVDALETLNQMAKG